jgi:hypothetical protein
MWWKVLGRKTAAVGIGLAFDEEIRARSARRKDRERFLKLLEKSEPSYFFDTWKEIHVFMYRFPKDVSTEDLEFAKGMIDRIIKSSKDNVVELEGQPQVFSIVLTAAEDTDLYRYRRENRDEILNAWEQEAVENPRKAKDVDMV